MVLYARFDCHFPDDPKVVEAGDRAELVYVRCVLRCREHLTDGVIDRRVAGRWCAGIRGRLSEHFAALVRVHLVEEVSEGWRIPAEVWSRWNPTAAQVEQQRDAETARKRQFREAKRQATAEVSQESPNGTGVGVPSVSAACPRQPEPEPEPEPELVLTPPSTDVDKRDTPDYRFDDFWSSYPQRKGRRVGRTKALDRWKRLSYDDKAAAFRGVSHYRTDCDAERTIAKDPERWLRDRCWEDWQDEAEPVRAMGKQDRRLIDSGLVDAYLEACNPNGQPAITTGATT